MDQPDLPPDHHAHALHDLSRINWWSHSAGILWPPLRALARELHPRPLRVLDLATGGGDLPIRLWFKARRAGLNLELAGCDLSSVAIEHARARAVQAGADVAFFVHDVLRGDVLTSYDAVTASLFLHHQTSDEAAITLLRRMGQMAGRLVLVNDLERGRLHLWLARLACRLLTSSYVVQTDGPRSVEAAFTVAEARRLAEQAGLTRARVAWRWPFRYLLTWRRPQ
jgi:ubiquinone/menaquinone biosynthesis C-methylase UbiE